MTGPETDPDRDWPVPPPSGDAPRLAVEGFEGPLDWLLEQARAKRIDLARLSIAALVAAFEAALLDALDQADDQAGGSAVPLARWADWLVMAAELTVLRSRLLLADDAPQRLEAEAEAELLRRRLLTRAAAAAAARWLDRRDQLGREVFARGMAEPGTRTAVARTGDITGLLRACLVALALPPDAGAAFAGPAVPLWSVSDAIGRLRSLLAAPDSEPVAFARALPAVPMAAAERPLRCRAAVASTLGGVLELVRDGELRALQAGPADEITLRAQPGGEPPV